MDRSAKFWDRIADRYAKRPVSDAAAYQKKLQVTRKYLRPDMEVLEFGCGTGSTAIAHAPYAGHIRAIDVSSRMIEIARRNANAAGVANVSFEQATIEQADIPDLSLDAVLALNVLHLLDDLDDTIAKVHRLLKPGGVFVSSTICLSDLTRLIRAIAPIGTFLGLMPPVRFFSLKDLEDSLIAGGFRIDHEWQPDKGKAVFIVAKKA